MKKLLICSAMFWTFISAYAQNTITGNVIDKASGEVLSYVTIYNIQKKQGVVTDFRGQYSIEAEANKDSLKISYLGYEPQIVLASNGLKINLIESAISLDEVIISGNREQEKRTESPIAVSTVSTTTIDDNKPTTIDQVINQTPGVNMVALGNEQHTMSIRRPIDYGASYLYLEDGIPIRTSGVFNHNALLEINMANTSKIEIIRGPASSTYGSEAIGGAINFISKRPTEALTAGLSLQGSTLGYKRADFSVSNTINKKLGVRLTGYYADQTDGVIEYSDFNKLALSLALNYWLTDKSELSWNTSYIDYYSDMTGSLDSALFYDKSYGSNQTFTNRQVDALRTKLAYKHFWNSKAKTTVTGYVRSNSVKQNPTYRIVDDYSAWNNPNGNKNLAYGQLTDNAFKSYGIVAQHKQDFDFLNSSLVAGTSLDFSPNTYTAESIEIYKNDDGIYESFEETDIYLADFNADLLNFAAYAQLKVQPFKGLNVIGGLRYDRFNYDFDNHLGANDYTSVLDGQNTFSQLTPTIGATYDLKNNRGVYANFSKGFVPPQVTELYVGEDIPSLKPVYYNNIEAGGWITLLKEKAKIDLSVYKMDGKDEIISVLQDNGSFLKQNVGETTHQGIEYGLNVFPTKDLKLRVSGTNAIHKYVEYNDNGIDYNGKDLPLAPKFTTNTQLTYKPSYLDGFRISVEWQHLSEYYMDQLNTQKYEGYDVFNLRLGYKYKSFDTWLNVLNATNTLYATVASASSWGTSYSLGNPLSLTLGLGYKFVKKEKKKIEE